MPAKDSAHPHESVVTAHQPVSPGLGLENPFALPALEEAVQRSLKDPRQVRPQDVQQLQRAIGNQATIRRLDLQPKLTVGAAGDAYEQEADRTAARVLAMPEPQNPQEEKEAGGQRQALATDLTPVQRRTGADPEGSFDAGTDVEASLAAGKGGGTPLPNEVRDFMEPRFGADFSSVRVHTDSESAQLNRRLSAQAFTHGQDIYMGAGKSVNNKALMAHELTHTIQQGAAPVARKAVSSGISEKGVVQRVKGVAHVANSCYLASILHVIANTPRYARLFNLYINPQPQNTDSERLLSNITPLIEMLQADDMIGRVYIEPVLKELEEMHILQSMPHTVQSGKLSSGQSGNQSITTTTTTTTTTGGTSANPGEKPAQEQQDAGEVLERMLSLFHQGHALDDVSMDIQEANPNGPLNYRNLFLPLIAHGNRTLLDALQAYFNPQGQDETRRAASFPEVLNIAMSRNSQDDQISMPSSFTIPATITHDGQEGPRYRLTSFIVRDTFREYKGGHYVAVIRDPQKNQWFEADDMRNTFQQPPRQQVESIDPNTHRMKGHDAPAYALATLYIYERDDAYQQGATDFTEFPSAVALNDHITGEIFADTPHLSTEDKKERMQLIQQYQKSGLSVFKLWDLLKNHRDDKNNTGLKNAFALYTREKFEDQKSTPKEKEEALQNKTLLKELEACPAAQLTAMMEEKLKDEKKNKTWLILAEIVLQAKMDREESCNCQLIGATNENGMEVTMWGTHRRAEQRTAHQQCFLEGIMEGLLNSDYLNSFKPPLKIRILFPVRKTTMVACTNSKTDYINIEMEDYQIDSKLFSVGRTLGLLAHELGVHTLDQVAMTTDQREKEDKKHQESFKGSHGQSGISYTMTRDYTLEDQQQDHVTIGKGVLGQEKAQPRLQMYERTMLSLIRAIPEKCVQDRWEVAAAYSLDVARILVTNDTASLTDIVRLGAIKTAAVYEWQRIKTQHKDNEEIQKIEITPEGLQPCAMNILQLIAGVRVYQIKEKFLKIPQFLSTLSNTLSTPKDDKPV